tara:strand:+ start:5610 stop:6944 length:1335 start_codon:yes stop_codon:yes gene_type:complete
MSEEELKKVKTLNRSGEDDLHGSIANKSDIKVKDKTSVQPNNQLSGGLLGWYSTCSSKELKDGKLYFFSMYNEPLVLYRDKDSIARCVKDLCPHRGASFLGGEVVKGEILCPYHGARFSPQGKCTNLDKITCQHIIDSNYDNYAKSIKLLQYPCIERGGYIYIYYNGCAETNLEDFEIKTSIEHSVPESYGLETSEYEYEEVFVDFKADWARIIENHMDILHVFWMHGDTIPDKNVSRNTMTSFEQKITIDNRQIESVYSHRIGDKEEFIRIKFVPPGRVFIYKDIPQKSRYVQVLDHIPLGKNRARVIVRHYRKFLKNKLFTNLFLFTHLQHRTFYKIFSEDYIVLRTQTFNEQMGYIQKDNVKLLGEDKMVQYYWDWLQNALNKDKPWELHPTNSETNKVHDDLGMIYPPENPKLAIKNSREIKIKLAIRALIPLGLLIILL